MMEKRRTKKPMTNQGKLVLLLFSTLCLTATGCIDAEPFEEDTGSGTTSSTGGGTRAGDCLKNYLSFEQKIIQQLNSCLQQNCDGDCTEDQQNTCLTQALNSTSVTDPNCKNCSAQLFGCRVQLCIGECFQSPDDDACTACTENSCLESFSTCISGENDALG